MLQHAYGLSLQAAVEQAKAQHDETLARYLMAEQQIRELSDQENQVSYLELLQARIRGIHDWAVVSGRYR